MIIPKIKAVLIRIQSTVKVENNNGDMVGSPSLNAETADILTNFSNKYIFHQF